MSRALLTLIGPPDSAVRRKAIGWIMQAPEGTRVEFKAARRSVPQNDRMWAMLTEVATKLKHHGLSLSPEDWKLLFMDALKREKRIVPNLDGNGFVALTTRSSDLSKEEMSDLMELIAEYGARHGVQWQEEKAA